jgi:hypothetical protein
MALSLIGALIDPSQPPCRWPLEELMGQLHVLVNADPFQLHHDTLGGWWVGEQLGCRLAGWRGGWVGLGVINIAVHSWW